MALLYDLQASVNGRLITDLTTGSKRRVIERAIELDDQGVMIRVTDSRGVLLGPEDFFHDRRSRGTPEWRQRGTRAWKTRYGRW